MERTKNILQKRSKNKKSKIFRIACGICGKEHNRTDETILSRFMAGESLRDIKIDYGLLTKELEDALRQAIRQK